MQFCIDCGAANPQWASGGINFFYDFSLNIHIFLKLPMEFIFVWNAVENTDHWGFT